MDKNNNIYSYKIPKSMNEETHFFLTNGRITIKAFFLRFLFVSILYIANILIYLLVMLPNKEAWLNKFPKDQEFKKTFEYYEYFVNNFWIILSVFIIIQLIKRIQDTNKSGWLALVPFYNIILLFSSGTEGNNDYGVDPRPQKKIKYFDELEKK